MAGPYVLDRVKETTTTTGTGTLTLLGAVTGFRAFSAVGDGNSCFYCVEDGTSWEVGIGTYTLSGTTLSRSTVLASSNAGALVSFGAGTKNVFVTAPAAWFGTPLTPGSIPFVGTGGVLAQDNANLFYDGANDFLGLGTAAPAQRLHVNSGWLRFDHAAAPAAPAAALAGAGAGNVENGTHVYLVTFVTAQGEGQRGAAVTLAVVDKATNGKVSLTGIPLGATGVTSRKVYRSVAGGGPPLLLTTIADNTTTTYTDNTADASLGAVAPSFGATAGKLIAAASPGGTEVDGPVVAESGRSHGFFYDRGGAARNVRSYGAVSGATIKTNGAMTAASATLTSSGFAATDVGKICSVAWAGTNQIANPTVAATVAVTGGGTTGGILAAGTYRVKYTWTTTYGETTAGTSESTTFTVAYGNIPRVTIPSLPANATGANVYLTPLASGGTTNTEVQYGFGCTATTYDLALTERSDGVAPPSVNRTAGPLNSVITGFTNSTTVTLADAAVTTVASADVIFGWDDTAGFQAAIDAGTGIVYVPAGNYIVGQLRLKTTVTLRGAGFATQVNQRPGTSGHMIVVDDNTVLRVGVAEIALHGRKLHQTTANDGINFTASGLTGDSGHTLYRVRIEYCRGDGIAMGADVRGCLVMGCYMLYNDGINLSIESTSTDSLYVGNVGGQSGLQGCKIAGNNNNLNSNKFFWSGQVTTALGYAFHVTANNNELTGCTGQDSQSHDLYIDGCSRTSAGNFIFDNSRQDAVRLNNCFDSVVRGTSLSFVRNQRTCIANLVGGALRNSIEIAFDAGAVATGNAYVQGTPTGNDVHVGPDGGYQAPAFPSVPTWTVVTATDVITTSTVHGLSVNDPVYVSNSGGALPASTPQIAVNTPYFVKTVPSTTTLTISATAGGTTIDFTGTGTGTQSMQLPLVTNPYSGNTYKLTLTANLGIAAPLQQHQGQRCSFEFTQDGTGGREVTWENVFLLRNWTVLARPNQVSSIDFVFDGTNWVQHGGITDLLLSSTMGVTTTSVSSTTTAETKSLIGTISGSFTCMPNFMTVGRKLRLKLNGNMTTGITAGTVTFQVKFAGTVIASTGAIAPTVSLTNMYWEAEVDIICRTTGATGTFFVQGKFSKMNAVTGATTSMITWPIRGNSADPPAVVTVSTVASSLVDFQSITSNNLHTITCNMATLEVLN